MKGDILFGALATAACGALVAAPAKAGTVYIGVTANSSTITMQNAGTPGIDGGASNGKNWSRTAKFWAPLSEAGLRTANSPARVHNTQSDTGSDLSVTERTGEGPANSTMEVTTIPEPWTWLMIGLGFASVGVLRLIRPRRKQPRYIV